MTFPEIVKTTLWDIIDEMSHSLSSFVKNPDKDFIRKRKLDFKKMMHLIISMESGSLNHELLKFFEYDSSVPTNSAFYQQRSKLSVSAFRHLLKEFNLKFPLEKFRGKYYLIACDGSEFNIARNPDDPDTFHEPNGKSVSGFNMVHTKKTEYVAFELWSRLILYNFCSIIILHVPVKSRNRKHEYQVNFSLAMKICFDFLRGVAPSNAESLISKYILPIRPNRNYARQHRVQKPASFSYRFV